MREAKYKDEILKYLVDHSGWGNTENISAYLQLEHSSTLTLSKQIASDNLVTIAPTVSFKMENVHLLHLKPEGEHFYKSTSYAKKERGKIIESAPKKYWWVAAIFAIIAFVVPMYLQYCTKQNQPQIQSKPLEKSLKTSTHK